MQVGKQIQHYRKEKNLSQDELAEIIFVSRQSIPTGNAAQPILIFKTCSY